MTEHSIIKVLYFINQIGIYKSDSSPACNNILTDQMSKNQNRQDPLERPRAA